MKNLLNIIFKYRKFVILFSDMLVVFFSTLIINLFLHPTYTDIFLKTFIVQAVIYASVFIMFNIYNKLWRCADIRDISICFLVAILAGVIYNIYLVNANNLITIDYCILNTLISTFSLCSYRIAYKFVRNFILSVNNDNIKNKDDYNNTIIIAREDNLNNIAFQLINLNKSNYNIKGIVTDNEFITNTTVNGIKVLGLTADIKDICEKYKIKNILINSDISSEKNIINTLNALVKNKNIKIYKIGSIENLNNINNFTFEVKETTISDLLGRDVVNIKINNICLINSKTILVTGGGGSIGSELCRQISEYNPKKLIILDNYENNAYSIQQELIRIYGNSLSIEVEIASVQDVDKLEKIFSIYKPDLVFHAAAHKHVPLMEHNPEESIKNNVFGTLNVVKMADKYNVEKFVLISSDKAVNPTNIMGATKRIAEMIIQYYSLFSCTTFSAVRFGNVLGSNGSVIPLFKKQIEDGGPVTVTHPNVVRYFMTISEAVELILQTAEIAKGGEIFVLDMGKPVKIKDLAENMIKLAGFNVGEDIDIKYIGLRPGEKLYEELLMAEEGLQKTSTNKIFIGKPIDIDIKQFIINLEKLKELAILNDSVEIFKIMPHIVPTYKNMDEINKGIESIKAI